MGVRNEFREYAQAKLDIEPMHRYALYLDAKVGCPKTKSKQIGCEDFLGLGEALRGTCFYWCHLKIFCALSNDTI